MSPPESPAPKRGRGNKPARPRPRDDGASIVGGVARRRAGGAMCRLGGPRLSVPQYEAVRSEGYEFPATPSTPKQDRELAKIVTDYLRRDFMKRHQGLPNETLAEALGMKPRNAAYMLALARKPHFRPAADLVIDVLHGMLTGEIAGVLGTRKNSTSRWVFKLVNDFDLTERDMHIRLCVDDDAERVADRDQCYRNGETFVRLHAAFRLEYMAWLRRK